MQNLHGFKITGSVLIISCQLVVEISNHGDGNGDSKSIVLLPQRRRQRRQSRSTFVLAEKKRLHANKEAKQSLTHMQTHFGFGETSHKKHPVFLIQFGSPTLFSKHTTGKKNPNFIIIHVALAPNPIVQFISSAKTIIPPP